MHFNKSLQDERMQSSRIKKYYSKDGVDTKHTQHNLGHLLSCIRGHIVHFTIVRGSSIGPLVAALVLLSWWVLLLRTLMGIVAKLSTTVADIGVFGRNTLH